MAAFDDITPPMVDAGVRALLAAQPQRTPAEIVCDVFVQVKAAQSQSCVRKPQGLSSNL